MKENNAKVWAGETVCDVCGETCHELLFDAKIPARGCWGTLCRDCFDDLHCELGTGKGQMYRANDNDDFVKVPYTPFARWLDTFIREKGVNVFHVIEVEGESFTNFIEVRAVLDFLKALSSDVQATVKNKLAQIDFYNGDVMHFLTYCAKYMAC